MNDIINETKKYMPAIFLAKEFNDNVEVCSSEQVFENIKKLIYNKNLRIETEIRCKEHYKSELELFKKIKNKELS